MGALGQARRNLARSSGWSFLDPSIVWKLTLFVGILVALVGTVLIVVAYVATSGILRDQIHKRLSTVAIARQDLLKDALQHLEDKASQLASSTRIDQLLSERASGSINPEQFQAAAGGILASARSKTVGMPAVWIEDPSGGVIASSGPDALIAAYRGAKLTAPKSAGGLVVPQQKAGGFRALVCSEVVTGGGATIRMLADFGPIAALLIDPRGLEDSGEVLVGVQDREKIRLVLPPRSDPSMTDVAASELPTLAAAGAGEFGFRRTRDHRGVDVLVAYMPVGAPFPGWGLIAKVDTAEAYAPVRRLRWLLLALGGMALVMGLAASNVIARRFARPIRRLARTAAAVAAGDLSVRSQVSSSDEIGALSTAFNRMTEELARSYATLDRRISERTRDLEAVRELLDALFRISTSRTDPDNIDKTLDSVLRFCSRLGYDLAMISLVDRDAGVIRAVRALGAMTGVVERTVRALDGPDILAIVAREGRAVVIADSTVDPRCEPGAVAMSGIRGQIVLPLVSDQVLGTLQVASLQPIDPLRQDLRPLETMASHTARALVDLRQLEEIRRLNQEQEQHASELASSEVALREQTQILKSVLDCMGDGVIVADPSAKFLVFNPAAKRILGHGQIEGSPQEWSRNYEIFLPDRSTPYPVEDLPLVRAIRGESVDEAELYIAYPSRDDGTWIHVNGRPLRDEDGVLKGGVVVFHDVTRQKKSERRLAAQYEATRVLAEADSPGQSALKILETVCRSLDWDLGAFWRVDAHRDQLRCVTTWSRRADQAPTFEALTRETTLARGRGLPGRVWRDAQPAWIPELAADPNFPRISAAVEDGLQAALALPIVLRGDCLGVLEFFSREARPPDIAILEMMNSLGTQIGQFIERHQMRARVMQSEKLASLGMLSAGVAHEINNPLAFVANNLAVLERDVGFVLRLLEMYEAEGESLAATNPDLIRRAKCLAAEFDLTYVKENLGKIMRSTRQGVKRVADIVQNLRGFARVDRATVDQADLHDALKTSLEFIRGRLERRHIVVEEHLGALSLVDGSPAQLNQVFLNLLVNAMQAIESTHRVDGRIAITTETRDGEILVEIADNGCGISEEILPLIFDPFFTTKGVGDGTGLGLSITHSIVQDHGGRLQVESTPAQGTRFRVILPMATTVKARVSDGTTSWLPLP
jgi:PAS domain S-box-containing protein